MATAQVSTDFEPDSPTLYPQATGSSGTLAVKIVLSPQLHGRRTDSHGHKGHFKDMPHCFRCDGSNT